MFIACRLAALMLAATSAQPMADPIPPQLVGTWRLVTNTIEETATGKTRDLFGKDPVGYIMYNPDGRMMILQVRHGRKRPSSSAPTGEEAEALFRSMIAYGGTFTIEGERIVHHVDISWNESWTGSDQVRFYKFDGDRVELSTEVSPDPVHGVMSVRRLVWEKVSGVK